MLHANTRVGGGGKLMRNTSNAVNSFYPPSKHHAGTEKLSLSTPWGICVKVRSRYRPGLWPDRGTRRGWVVGSTPRPYFTPGNYPVPIVQEAGWAPEPVCTDGKSRLTGIRSPDRPARSQSLYRLSYPAHMRHMGKQKVQLYSFLSSALNGDVVNFTPRAIYSRK